jgi:zinc/manganese transport system ATP-binding protein
VIGSVSGGQRGRALVAQGLAQDSDLLLLDEPAAGLDLEARQRIDTVLDGTARGGVTVLRVTHDPDVARRADHCLLLHEGRLVADGPPATVLRTGRSPRAPGSDQSESRNRCATWCTNSTPPSNSAAETSLEA